PRRTRQFNRGLRMIQSTPFRRFWGAMFTASALIAGCAPSNAPVSAGKSIPADPVTVAPPVIPDRHFSIIDYGGVGDGKAMNTAPFKKALAAISAAGGGHLDVPPGTFQTLPFTLASHMDLHLDAGAKIKAPDSLTGWGLPDPATATEQQLRAAPRPA